MGPALGSNPLEASSAVRKLDDSRKRNSVASTVSDQPEMTRAVCTCPRHSSGGTSSGRGEEHRVQHRSLTSTSSASADRQRVIDRSAELFARSIATTQQGDEPQGQSVSGRWVPSKPTVFSSRSVKKGKSWMCTVGKIYCGTAHCFEVWLLFQLYSPQSI